MNFTCIIVDDEIDGRYNLRTLLSESFPQITVLAEANNTESALKQIRKLDPDILFLDIQLEKKTSFEILKSSHFSGQIVFVTAHERYAIDAIKFGATDYILKPIHPEEFETAVLRVCEQLSMQKQDIDENICIRVNNRKVWVQPNQIIYLKAMGNYTEITLVNGRSYLVSNGLSHYQEILSVQIFVRTHRAYLVNSRHISEYNMEILQVTLMNGEKIPVSRRNKKMLADFL